MRIFFFAVIFSVTVLPGCIGHRSGNGGGGESLVQCGDVAGRAHLNILTVNLLFSEIKTRDQRLDAIADFAVDAPVDVILLQEVVGGVLVDTANSALDLQGKLRDKDSEYDLHTAFEVGLPGALVLANAVLSRCDIEVKMAKRLPFTAELEFKERAIKLPRNVMMTRIDIPGFGKLNVYNTHLCAKCSADEMGRQLDVLLTFVNDMEGFFPGNNPLITGGDFNIDRLRTEPFDEKPFYDRIINAGFVDAYAEDRILENLCKDTEVADAHCTVGVSSLDEGDSARRIDYIFTNGFAGSRESHVVFNSLVEPGQPTVSDHAGVFVSLTLP
jgi:maltose 6'-phosphate phosphatase